MNTTTVTRTEDSDLTCAECGTTTASTYVVTTLDPTNPQETRTEVCTDCHTALAAPPQTPTARPLTPYDTGERAEPSTWIPSNRHDHTRNPHADDYGKVDFDDSESVTIATVWATPHPGGWTLHIRETGLPITLDAHTDQLDVLAAEARTALADVEASTEADTFEDVIAARDAAANALQRFLDALRTDTA